LSSHQGARLIYHDGFNTSRGGETTAFTRGNFTFALTEDKCGGETTVFMRWNFTFALTEDKCGGETAAFMRGTKIHLFAA
jgi:hypothetical protein